MLISSSKNHCDLNFHIISFRPDTNEWAALIGFWGLRTVLASYGAKSCFASFFCALGKCFAHYKIQNFPSTQNNWPRIALILVSMKKIKAFCDWATAAWNANHHYRSDSFYPLCKHFFFPLKALSPFNKKFWAILIYSQCSVKCK